MERFSTIESPNTSNAVRCSSRVIVEVGSVAIEVRERFDHHARRHLGCAVLEVFFFESPLKR